MSDQVAEYRGLVESLAEEMVRTRAARNALVDYDDLVQEGLIDVWKALDRGATPAKEQTKNVMRKWIRKMGRQRRGETETVSMDVLLPWLESGAVRADVQTRRDVAALVRPQE